MLNQITETLDSDIPTRTAIYSEHKQGKSTFGSMAPNPIFIISEDGLSAIKAKSFPLCEKWEDAMDHITTLYNEKHDYKTVVMDSIDWFEKLAHEKVARDNGVKGIEHIGYGRGYSFSADLFNEMLTGLNALRTDRKMNVILLCHSQIKRFDDPSADSYDKYELKLHKLISKMIMEWVDTLGFAQVETIVKIDKGTGFKDDRARAITTGRRVLHLVKTPAFDAGSRFCLPETIPFQWSEYETALNNARKQ